jgi:hypothetical protein
MKIIQTNSKHSLYLKKQGDFLFYFYILYFICRPSDFTVSEDAGIEHRAVATSALAVRRSNHYIFFWEASSVFALGFQNFLLDFLLEIVNN